MAADAKGMDLGAVGIPVFGVAAWKPEGTSDDLVASADGGKPDFKLPDDYISLGLFKPDGGPQEASEAGDAIEFFQQGYKLGGDITRTMAINFAQTDPNIQRLITGKKPDENGMIVLDDTDNEDVFPLFIEVLYKNKTMERFSGMARVSTVEVDQRTRGENKGHAVTFEWVHDDAVDGLSRYWLLPHEGANPTPPPTGTPKLSIANAIDKTEAKPGDNLLCTVTVKNTGDGTFTGSVTNDLSKAIDRADYGGNAKASTGSVAFTSPNLTWTGEIPAGDTLMVTYTLTVKTDATDGQLIITVPSPEGVESSCDPSCEATVDVAKPADAGGGSGGSGEDTGGGSGEETAPKALKNRR